MPSGSTVTSVHPEELPPLPRSLARFLQCTFVKRAPDAHPCWDISFVKLIVNNKRDVFCSSLLRNARLLGGWMGLVSPR